MNDKVLHLIEELRAGQLVVEQTADEFAFRHALTREAVYTTLLVRERQRYHRAIAETMERVYGKEVDSRVADLAYHFYEAGAWEKALDYSERAGEEAKRLFAPREAIGHLTRALEAAGRQSLPPPAKLLRARGQAYETVGDFESARGDYGQVLAAARTAHDGAAEWQSLIDLGFLWAGRDYEHAGEFFRLALELAQSLGDPKLRAHSLNRFGNWLLNVGQAAESLQAHREALVIFQAQQDRHGTAETLDLLGLTSALYGDLAESDNQRARAIDLFRELDDKRGLIGSLTPMLSSRGFAETVLMRPRRLEEYERHAAEALSLARQIDWPAGQAMAEWSLSVALTSFGEFGRALAYASEALRLGSEIAHRQWVTAAHFALGRAYTLLFQPDLAIRYLEQALPLTQELGSAFWTGNVVSELVLAYLLKSDFVRAETALGTFGNEPPDGPPRNLAERRVMWARGELALARGEAESALRLAEQLIQTLPGENRKQPVPMLLHLRGRALMELRHLDKAEHDLAEAKRSAVELGVRPLLWQVHASLGMLQRRLKREDEAKREFDAARGIIQSLAATIDEAALREAFTRAALERLPLEKSPPRRRTAKKRVRGSGNLSHG